LFIEETFNNEDRESTERKHEGLQMRMPTSNAVHPDSIEFITTSGPAAGKAEPRRAGREVQPLSEDRA
jgi:hypothetical protein